MALTARFSLLRSTPVLNLPGAARHRLLALQQWVWRCGVLLAFCCLALPSVAQGLSPSEMAPRLESLGRMPNSVVSALAQDQAGFVWVGSAAGLMRFDGYSFRPLLLPGEGGADKRSLGFVRSLLVAKDGRLWVGTDSGGVIVHDPVSEAIKVLTSDTPGQPGGVPGGTILTLAEDRDGGIWVGSGLYGLARIDPADQSLRSYRHSDRAGSLPDDRVQAALVDRQGDLWVGSFTGLARKRAGSEHFENVPLPGLSRLDSPPLVLRLMEAEDGQIWVATQQGDLLLLSAGSREARLVERRGSRGAIYALMNANAQQVWVGRASGVELRAAADGRVEQLLRHNPRNPATLSGNEVRSLLRDRAGSVWVGGFGSGLQRYNADNKSIGVRRLDDRDDAVFEDPSARALLELSNGDIWVGTTANGIGILDAQLNLKRQLQLDTRPAAHRSSGTMPPMRVAAMAQIRDGSIWIGSESRLLRVNEGGQLLQSLTVGQGRVRRIVLGRDGVLWVGTQDGLQKLDPGQAELQRMSQAAGEPLRGDINAIVEAPDGTLWVGGETGLYRLSAGAQALEKVRSPAGRGLAHATITGLLLDRRQQLWVDTAVGLHKLAAWDGKMAAFDRISERHGIAGRAFGANLLEDGFGRIWSQVYVYDPSRDHLHELTPADGADAGTTWFRSYTQLRNGRFLFGSGKGLMLVDADQFQTWTYHPPVVATELRIDGERVNVGRLQQGLTLAPSQRGFSLEFAALDYSDPTRCRYAYWLEGFDSGWIETGAAVRVASYSNLAPGHYRLRVKASNRSGLWSTHELSIPVQVLPAWWQSWWALLLFGLTAVSVLLALVRWRTAVLVRRQHALEERVRERTAELEQLSKALHEKTLALEEQSLSDPLTGLRNRRFVTQHIEADVAMSLRRHEDSVRQGVSAPDDADLVFFLLDIDHFKDINDRFGHAAGDVVLQQMRDRLRLVFRESDYLVRWGGEEFLIVARESSRAHAAELAARACAAVAAQPFRLDDGRLLSKTCSLGFACFPLAPAAPTALDWTQVIDLADAALYQVKRGGRNGWLGAISCGGGDAIAVKASARQAWAHWVDSGDLRVAGSIVPGQAPEISGRA
ncbi:two-component regulator propeller domain-containing protein [Roseateles sp. PN1]|uniref:two-component regulator propeller domain-containing protein n=1 Tax=Roseateles sp. PN1 TaxID=3137372 RepID=UPI00313904DE